MRDRDGKGRQANGERNGQSKVTADKVIEIRKGRDRGMTIEALAIEHGVSKMCISRIVRGVTWRHITYSFAK